MFDIAWNYAALKIIAVQLGDFSWWYELQLFYIYLYLLIHF